MPPASEDTLAAPLHSSAESLEEELGSRSSFIIVVALSWRNTPNGFSIEIDAIGAIVFVL